MISNAKRLPVAFVLVGLEELLMVVVDRLDIKLTPCIALGA
jgi:hypothetical protein